jgi:hypothetical protein
LVAYLSAYRIPQHGIIQGVNIMDKATLDLNTSVENGCSRIDSSSGDDVEMADSSDRDDEIFDSPLVQSIRQKHATIEKISDYVWEDMKNQDPEDVF